MWDAPDSLSFLSEKTNQETRPSRTGRAQGWVSFWRPRGHLATPAPVSAHGWVHLGTSPGPSSQVRLTEDACPEPEAPGSWLGVALAAGRRHFLPGTPGRGPGKRRAVQAGWTPCWLDSCGGQAGMDPEAGWSSSPGSGEGIPWWAGTGCSRSWSDLKAHVLKKWF